MQSWVHFAASAAAAATAGSAGHPPLLWQGEEERKPLQHWCDPELSYAVYMDICNGDMFVNAHGACFALADGDWCWVARAHKRSAFTAAAARAASGARTPEGDESPEIAALTAILCVNAGIDVVPELMASAAEQTRAWLDGSRTADEADLPLQVKVAFCDGPSIIYYSIHNAIEPTGDAKSGRNARSGGQKHRQRSQDVR
ncbi:hypothetical protein JKP88DRAFT_169207 [Tribonema minus]|uniref:Uncharacterized protein n=1 Tax=Tribonema minus TaxID=303371 RepID=A0A835YQH5_9STRA|nr:hypothetical protein JKP88DRAFT_169207 [Tribonema minus]